MRCPRKAEDLEIIDGMLQQAKENPFGAVATSSSSSSSVCVSSSCS